MHYNIKLYTPFAKAKKYVGMSPEDCLVMDKDLFDSMPDEIELIFNIEFRSLEVHESRSIYASDVRDLLKNGKAIIRTAFNDGKEYININRKDCKLK